MIKHILKLIWRKKTKNALILLEVFLSFLVLFGTLSYVLSNLKELRKPLGFETENKWIVYLNDYSQSDSAEVATTLTNLKNGLEQMTYINSVGFSNSMTVFSGSTNSTSSDDNGFEIRAKYIRGDEDLGDALGINMLQGRWFEKEDENGKYPPMIVSKNFVDEYYPNKNMLDSVIIFGGERKIVGVMEDFRYQGQFIDELHSVFLYQPSTDREVASAYLNMSPDVPASYEQEVNDMVAELTKDNSFMIANVEELRDENAKQTWIPMLVLLSICVFLCINVALGLFGVLWYNINKRRSEVGLRRALGAHHTDISKQFILEILMLAGLAIGLGVFFAIQIPLLKVTELESAIYYRAILYSIIIVVVLVLFCAYFPSKQAASISPAIALHED